MESRRHCLCKRLVLLVVVVLLPATAFPAGGTSKIASNGQPVPAAEHWPAGLEAVVNDPARTDGWNAWFTEWPNDVVHYQHRFAAPEQTDVTATTRINALLKKFAAIRAGELHVHLSPQSEPRGYGWVSSLPEGNGTPVMLSIGNQQRIDEWYRRLGGEKFGVMEFTAAPVAVPPTLTIYTRNPAVDLDRLEIPDRLTVTVGGVPGVFHVSNVKPAPKATTTINRKHKGQAEPPPESSEKAKPAPAVDPALQKQIERLEEYVAKRNRRIDCPPPPTAVDSES